MSSVQKLPGPQLPQIHCPDVSYSILNAGAHKEGYSLFCVVAAWSLNKVVQSFISITACNRDTIPDV